MADEALEFRVLGPLAVLRDGVDLALGGPRQRLVLALLLVNAGQLVPAERLVDDIWGEAGPTTRTGPLRTYVWQLRQLLGGDAAVTLQSRSSGYRLDIDRERIDSTIFEAGFAEARSFAASGRPWRALNALETAVSLWRGPAFGDLAIAAALQNEARRLDELLLAAKELRAELLLATGQHALVPAELGALARTHPERERLWALLMTALYRSGRQGEALRCFQEARARLVEDMGLEPGVELRDLEKAVLSQDPALDWQPPGPAQRNGAPDAFAGTTDAGAPTSLEAPSTESMGLHNLPRQLTSFIGRGAERAAIADALAGSRLVTLAGTGGSGKSRLALAVAGDLGPRFPEGVWFVDLAPVTDPALILRTIAGPLGVETDQADQLDQLCRRIGDGELLLVVDNCEHLVEAVAVAVEQLLERCAGLRILATSREEIRVGSEVVWRVPPLSLPGAGNGARGEDEDEDLDQPFLGSEAVELFVERGRAALGSFAPRGEALEAVAEVCRRLDGIPLAIELAAALVGSLPVPDIAARLHDRFRLLDPGARKGVSRHRTLRATLDWSFDLLDEDSRRLFVQLGVFVGDFTLAAAETVAGRDAEPLAVVRGLGRLVVTSMVNCVAGSEGADRYRMLETIRQYAREKLDALDEAEAVHWRHAAYYAEFAAEAERHVHGAAGSTWLARVVSELPNLREAVAWAMGHDDVEMGLRLAGSLRWFFARMALLEEGARWLDEGLAHRADLSPELRLMGLTAASTVAWMRGDFSRTRDLGEEGIAVARQLGDQHQLAIALIVRGAAVVYEGDLERAEQCFKEAHGLCEQLGDRWGLAWMLTCWSVASRRSGRPAVALGQLEEALAIFRALHDRHGQVLPLVNLALAAQEMGDLDEAHRLASEAAAIATSLRDRQLQHVSLCVLGRVELSRGHLAAARDLLVHSIRGFPGGHNQLMVAIDLEGLAVLAVMAGHPDDAATVMGFTHQLRERWKITLSGNRAREVEDWRDAARDAIGVDRFDLEFDRGHALGFDDAVDLAEAATIAPD
jgi:predicted ATPase/DNA-binding SARP family transcriptional activator